MSVHVDDLAKAEAFYGDRLGLRRVVAYPGEVFYDLAGTLLCVHADAKGECGRAPGGATGFYLQVPDLARARRALEAAGVAVAWSEDNALSFEDPDGNEFVLWQPRVPWPPA